MDRAAGCVRRAHTLPGGEGDGTVSVQPWAVLDLAGTAVGVGALVVLHLLPSGLSPLTSPVSQYGITRYRLGYRIMTVALGVAGLAAASGFGATRTAGVAGMGAAHRWTIVAPLAVFGVCRLMISWWPMDAPGTPPSTRGGVHLFLALGAFLTAPIAANRLLTASGAALGHGFRATVHVAFWLMVVGLVGMFVLRRVGGRRLAGAAERLIYLGIVALLVATGLALG